MTNKRLKYKFLIYLRSIGFLCKKRIETSKRIRVAKTVYPDGEIVTHPPRLSEVPKNKHSFESELHVYHEVRKDLKK
jgi:hypothetical protein